MYVSIICLILFAVVCTSAGWIAHDFYNEKQTKKFIKEIEEKKKNIL